MPIDAGRFIAGRIDGARMVALDGDDHFPFSGDIDPVISELASSSNVEDDTFVDATAPRVATRVESGFDRLLVEMAFEQPIELGRFTVERVLGRGGMGTVFLAQDRDLARRVALKVLTANDAGAFRRFRREAMAVARLSHANVVHIYELGLDAPVPYLVMEYVSGGSVADQPARLEWRRALRIIAGAARGLGAAHAVGIVHRDVKPSNLLLVERTGDLAKVADFGVAKLAGAEPLTKAGGVVGTLGYLAPEQARGEAVDPRSDVYALAASCFRMICGRNAFTGTPTEIFAKTMNTPMPDASKLVAELPKEIAALIQKLGALDPRDRPVDGRAAAEAIDEALV